MRRVVPRFNPPPGWPPAPSPEWLPGRGWQPDPSWPDPPPGWPLVVGQDLRGKRRACGVREHPWRVLAVGILLVASCFAAYWGWLGWDHAYQVDPDTGVSSGPYEPWQVAGCVLSLAVVALACGLAGQPWAAVVVMPFAFTVAWSIPASRDETGLWGVGAIMIFIGMSLGALILAWPASRLRERSRRPPRNRPPG